MTTLRERLQRLLQVALEPEHLESKNFRRIEIEELECSNYSEEFKLFLAIYYKNRSHELDLVYRRFLDGRWRLRSTFSNDNGVNRKELFLEVKE